MSAPRTVDCAHAVLMAASAAACAALALPLFWFAAAASLSLVVLIATLLVRQPRGCRHTLLFTLANGVTLLRTLAIAALLLAVADVPHLAFAAGALLIFAMDALDGFAARRRNVESVVGARFDMEADAYFVMALALLLSRLQLCGAWVLTVGFWRYGYVLWVALLPGRGEAPRSSIGRTLAGVVMGCLIAALALGRPGSIWLAALATAIVTGSFGRSLYWTYKTI